jgi:hypothetical protein
MIPHVKPHIALTEQPVAVRDYVACVAGFVLCALPGGATVTFVWLE